MGHWYSFDGKPCHFQENGKDTTLREARKQNLLPSVTTIIGLLDKPALTNWKMKQVLLASLTLPTVENEPPDAFARRIMRDAFADSTDARDRGSEIHDCLEGIVLNRVSGKPLVCYPTDIFDIAVLAWAEVCNYCGREDFIAEQTVVGDGYAGMVDLHNDDFVIDWKTKDIKDTDTGKKLAYPEMCQQLTAYDSALGGKQRRLINVFIDRTDPGKVLLHEWQPEEAEKALKEFQLLVQLWQSQKNYFPNAMGDE